MTSSNSSFDQALANYRLETFNTAPGKRVATLQAAVEFVNPRLNS
jgi:hypothetical protein